MHITYLLVLISRILGFMSEHFKKKIRTAAVLEYSHLLVVDIIEMVRTSIFYSAIYDIALYSVHELLHHDLTIPQQSLAKSSYAVALGVRAIAIMELHVSYNTLKNFDVEKFLKENEKKKETDKIISDEKVDIKTRYDAMLQRDEFEKQFNYVFGMSLMFFIAGLETTRMKPFALRAVKYWSIMKIVVFFLLINTLQTMPILQVTAILIIQLVYSIYIVWAGLVKRIFLNFIFALVEFISELAILFFVGIGCLLTYVGKENLNQNTSTLIQLIAIFFILFSTVVNLIYSLFVIVKGLLNVINLLKARSLKNKINKQYEEYKKLNVKEIAEPEAASL